MSEINERFKELIELKTSSNRRYKELEEFSTIPAVSWRKAFNGKQRPTSEMLESLAKKWPEHAFWLLTGATDNEFSHTSPKAESHLDAPYQSRPAGEEYLRLRVALSDACKVDKTQSFREMFEDWLTEHQELGQKRWPWIYTVHPKLAARKAAKEKLTVQQSQLIEDAITKLNSTRNKRIAEFKAINDDQAS